MITGWIGFTIIVLAFFILNTKYSKWFYLIDALGTIFLIIESIWINSIVFVFVNSFILISLLLKHYKEYMTN